jgi:hypothetical protein
VHTLIIAITLNSAARGRDDMQTPFVLIIFLAFCSYTEAPTRQQGEAIDGALR